MAKPKVAVVQQQNQDTDFLTRSIYWHRFDITQVLLWAPQRKCILLTCLVPQCTDVGSARPRRCVGPPTSPQRLACRVAERLPSWRKALSDFGPHSRTLQWPRSAPTLQYRQYTHINGMEVSQLWQVRLQPLQWTDCVWRLTFVAGVGSSAIVYLVKSSWLTVGAFTEWRNREKDVPKII